MRTKDQFDRRQLLSLCALILLSPALRLIPSVTAAAAGRAAWLCALLAAPLLLLYIRLLCRALAGRLPGEGLPEMGLRALGERSGRALLLLFALWLLLYAAFILRAGSERLMITSFPRCSAAVFVVCLGLVSLLGALGPARTLARAARLVLPCLGGVLAVVLVFGLFSIRKENLLPLTVYDLGPALRGCLPVVDVLVFGLYGAGFLLSMVPAEPDTQGALDRWLGWMVLLLTLLSVAVTGAFSAPLTARLSQPFFTLTRNLVFFHSLERMEALVVTFWLFPDFLLTATLLFGAQYCLRLALGLDPRAPFRSRLDLSGGRWLIPLCGALAIGGGLLLAPGTAELALWSERLIPAINLAFAFGLMPLLFVLGRRKRLW